MAQHACFTLLVFLSGFALFAAGQTQTQGGGSEIGDWVCFGTGSICAVDLSFGDQCRVQEDAHGFGSSQYWECVCTSGSAAISEACDDCQIAYGIIQSKITNWTSTCSSKSFTLAPIPASVLAQQSSRNATLSSTIQTAEEPTYQVTIKATPTAPLPTVATTFVLPLATSSGSHLFAMHWRIWVPMAVGLLPHLSRFGSCNWV
ncbi:hypothetical protein VTK56DRAFT_10048 [Thermocarpiscus australiensis]